MIDWRATLADVSADRDAGSWALTRLGTAALSTTTPQTQPGAPVARITVSPAPRLALA
jgi:hypothetical protein